MSVMLFAFDAANQLIREDNGFINKTVTYTYDSWGNILTKSEYPYTTGKRSTTFVTVRAISYYDDEHSLGTVAFSFGIGKGLPFEIHAETQVLPWKHGR